MCPDCLHPVTNQRLLDSLHIHLDVKPTRVYATEEALHVQWEDGHLSDYPMKWLMRNSYQHDGVKELVDSPERIKLWGKEIASDPPEVEYSKVMESDQELLKWLTNIEKYGFCFVLGTPVSSDATQRFLTEKIGVICNSLYGQFWTFPATVHAAKG